MLPLTEALASRRTRQWLTGSGCDACADTYVSRLSDLGYQPGTMKLYLSTLAHFAHWCGSEGIRLAQTDERVVERFLKEHLPTCHCAIRCLRQAISAAAAMAQLLKVLRKDSIILPAASTIPSHISMELKDFETHLSQVRGLAKITLHCYVKHVRPFLLDFFDSGPVRIETLLPRDVARFVQRRTRGYKPASIKSVNNALRSYFAFKAMQGAQTTWLSAALPSVALWRSSTLPQIVPAEEIAQLLQSYDRTRSAGKRDYAIARCLVDLGLRRLEVDRLRLDDIDWRQGLVRIAAKGRRVDLLPLPHLTGRAIADYLRHGRPQTTRREIFVRHTPPRNAPAGIDLVRSAIRCAAARCGLKDRIRGTHVLRHTLAGRLVQKGAPLKEIADLLRHRSLDTITIYAKVDLPALSRVAMAWPRRQA